jgi:5-hydroxyisourate hydrolase
MRQSVDRRTFLGAASMAATEAVVSHGEAEAEASGGRMTVHILDLFSGTPARGVKIDLFMKKGEQMIPVTSVVTDADGRPESGPVLSGDAFAIGRYVIAFDLADYFKGVDKTLPANFFRKVSVEFEVTDKEMPLHIPLQCTPWTQACSVLPGG